METETPNQPWAVPATTQKQGKTIAIIVASVLGAVVMITLFGAVLGAFLGDDDAAADFSTGRTDIGEYDVDVDDDDAGVLNTSDLDAVARMAWDTLTAEEHRSVCWGVENMGMAWALEKTDLDDPGQEAAIARLYRAECGERRVIVRAEDGQTHVLGPDGRITLCWQLAPERRLPLRLGRWPSCDLCRNRAASIYATRREYR